MYIPQAFSWQDPGSQWELMRAFPLALLVAVADGQPEANLVPFHAVKEESGKILLQCHLARANTQWQTLAQNPRCLVVFTGPSAYVSPNWYPEKAVHHRVVPTWNYVMLQAHGKARIVEDPAWLERLVTQLTAQMEQAQPAPWSVGDAPREFLESQLKAVVGVEIEVTALRGKAKLSQNRAEESQESVIRHLLAAPTAGEKAMGACMEQQRRHLGPADANGHG